MIQIYVRSCYFQYESKTLRSNGSIRGAAHRIPIVYARYKHEQEPTRLRKLSQVFKNNV